MLWCWAQAFASSWQIQASSHQIISGIFRITSWHKSGQRNFTILWRGGLRDEFLQDSGLEFGENVMEISPVNCLKSQCFGGRFSRDILWKCRCHFHWEAGDDGFLETAILLNLLIRRCFSGNYTSSSRASRGRKFQKKKVVYGKERICL